MRERATVFRRKKRDEVDEDATIEDEPVDEAAETSAESVMGATEPRVTSGPWDVADAPEQEMPRLDLGGLLVTIPEGVELRVEVGPDGQVVTVVLADGKSTMQVNAFAAPRRSGIWDEVRTEIAHSLTDQGGRAEEVDGPMGRELRARVPAGERGETTTPARFVGYDGPRWFLRGLLTGPAATEPARAERLEGVFRGLVVVRGAEAMAPRDPLQLRLPQDAQAAAAAAEGEVDDLNPFERGPEITEVH
jgi:hypothetical protein